ncbi:hypothetical protein [Saccharothrix variisporea]|uniref:Uncharacterized protein n=1 Tax=Saccharothrix variisporea TaxID=543527 RepID=A0A495XDH6_9PSEU|nr:hypothetical protein [Saccharothrix variisporea]RKT72057.1 hypothetical protein DFJ66_5361 [Saccharothrix variisporea]
MTNPPYAVEVDPEFPPDGDWGCPVFEFGHDGGLGGFTSRWGATVVRVTAATEWVGLFPGEWPDGVDDVFATPDPGRLCVVAGGSAFVVRVDSPGEGAVVAQDRVHQVVPVGDRLVLLVSEVDVVALGPDGVAWRSGRLAGDGLRVVRADPDAVHCVGNFHYLGEDPQEFVLDPATGRVVAGPRFEWA